MSKRTEIEVFDTSSGMGGSFTVSIVRELGGDAVKVRVWYGRATPEGWQAWPDWDGYTFETTRDRLTKRRMMKLFKTGAGS